jgi:integrase
MTNYLDQTHSQQSRQTLDGALDRLLEHTAGRVRDGLRSLHTLRMQTVHVQWMGALDLPAELAEQLGAARLGAVQLEAFTPRRLVAVVELFRRGERRALVSLKTTAKRKSTLGRALRLAVERGELAGMPQLPEIGLPPLRPRMRVLRDYAELRLLLAALPQRRAEWVAVAVWTCQRPGDVERMRWSDVDLRSATPSMIIRSTKTRRPHGIRCKVPGPLVETLNVRSSRLREAGLSPAATDPLVDAWPNVSRMLPVVCVRHGLPPLSAMDLRHTGFSWMVRRKGITRAAQEWGGWSDFQMLSKYYAHALPAGLEQAADELASIVDEHSGGDSPSNRT